jgi:hypothetical protein
LKNRDIIEAIKESVGFAVTYRQTAAAVDRPVSKESGCLNHASAKGKNFVWK